MKKILLIVGICIFNSAAFCQKNSKNELARELLETSGSVRIAMQMMDNMIASFKRDAPNVPTELWDEFYKEIKPEELINLLVPVYTKYYTEEELKNLLEFYKSPLGQKVIEKLPFITQESYQVGEQWGSKIGEKAVARLKEKGYLK